MANIKHADKLKLEKLFSMSGGSVMDFTNQAFQQLVLDVTKIDIYNQRFAVYGTSKAKRLRAFWQVESDYNVGFLTKEMLDYWATMKKLNGSEVSEQQKVLYKECFQIANNLLGVSEKTTNFDEISVEEEFLNKEFKDLSLENLGLDEMIVSIMNSRIIEIQKSIENRAPLSAILMSGSVLEGLLLGTAVANMREFNECSSSPKSKDNGKVLPFHEWTLNSLIDVAYGVGILELDVKKFSHSLRDFRNFIHPYEQMSAKYNPDIDTAKISWQVLKAAISDLNKYKKRQ